MSLFKQWRHLLLAVLAIVALGVFVACSDDDDDDGGDGGDGGGSGQAPADQQVLVTHSGIPQFIDPQRSNFEQDIALIRMMFRGLYTLEVTDDGGAEAAGAYADGEPEVSEDGTVFTVTIKDGLTWSDGEPLVAQHFVDGIVRGCDPAVASPYSYLLQSSEAGGIIGVAGCDALASSLGTAAAPVTPTAEETAALKAAIGAKAIDDTTLEITLVEPKLPSTFKQVFSLWVAFPARLDVVEQFGDKWTEPANIVVNGPFTLSEFSPQDRAVLVPNEAYGLDPKPILTELTVVFQDDYARAEDAFKTGEYDQVRVPDTSVPLLGDDPEYSDELLVVGSGRITALETQLTDETLSDFNVRLALSKAIDRDTFSEVTTTGVGLPAEYWLVDGLPGFQGRDKFKKSIGYDPEGAKAALAEAGYPDGEGFPTLGLLIADTPVRKAQAEFLQKAFKDNLNIDISIEVVDSKTRAARFNAQDFDLFIGGWQLDYPDPENPIVGLFNTGGGNNKYNCSLPELDDKIAEASAAQDFDAHVKGFQEAEDLIVENLCGAIPMIQEGLPYLVDSTADFGEASGTIDAGQPGNWCPECWFVKEQ